MGLRLITPPADEPISLDEAKAHLRITHNDQDDLIYALIQAARNRCEEEVRRAFITQTWELALDQFETIAYTDTNRVTPILTWPSRAIYLPRPPLQSILSVTYLDGDGETAYLHDTVGSPEITGSLAIDLYSEPARLLPVYGGAWPATYAQSNAVAIRFRAGYGDSGESVPASIKAAILLLLGHLFENTEAVGAANQAELPLGVKFLLEPFRVLAIA